MMTSKMLKRISYATSLFALFAMQSATAGNIPVTMSGPLPAIVSSAAPGSTTIYTYTITNNVPQSFPITVSGISGPVSRVTSTGPGIAVSHDCGSRLPVGPTKCTISIAVAPTTNDNGQTFHQQLAVDYRGRYPLTGDINFTVTSAAPVLACGGPGAVCRVFLSATTTQGDISGASALTGPAATACSQPGVVGDPFRVANCICNFEAVNQRNIHGSNFSAWLSDDINVAPTNINYAPTLTYTSLMPNGGVIADASNNIIVNGSLLSPIVPNATLGDFAYTGTNPDGTAETGFNCTEWTTNSGFTDGAAGRQVGSDGSWTLWSNDGCDTPHPLYCFEHP